MIITRSQRASSALELVPCGETSGAPKGDVCPGKRHRLSQPRHFHQQAQDMRHLPEGTRQFPEFSTPAALPLGHSLGNSSLLLSLDSPLHPETQGSPAPSIVLCPAASLKTRQRQKIGETVQLKWLFSVSKGLLSFVADSQ